MAQGRSYKFNSLEVMVGNSKLGQDTMIFNMGSAHECPSRMLGTCKLGSNCYALKAERMYPTCKPYRDRQQAYWLNTDAKQIARDIIGLLKSKKRRINGKLVPLVNVIKWFRFNEAGDFHSQECIEKLNYIAYRLLNLGIEAYGYSARADLDFSTAIFNCKGSGHDQGNNGKTIARKPEGIPEYVTTQKGIALTVIDHVGYSVCPMDCKKCDLCKTDQGINICFPLH